MKAIYCYWGALGDHSLNIPGHPLYQLYFLKVLQKKFGLKKIYFYSFLKDKVEKSTRDCKFFINEKQRKKILQELNIEIVSFAEALSLLDSVDYVFLKARFRNPSRLIEKSYDALKFETLLGRTGDKSKIWIIDSDGELPESFFQEERQIVTYFQKADKFYLDTYKKKVKVATIPCALHEDFSLEAKPFHFYVYDLFFIGNEGLKQKKLPAYLDKLALSKFKIGVNGKWKSRHPFTIFPRTEREAAYIAFEHSLSTLQISKEKYREYSFLSPRIYEAAVVGILPFIEKGYLCTSSFNEISSFIDLREKLSCLLEGYERDYQAVKEAAYQKLYEIEKELL